MSVSITHGVFYVWVCEMYKVPNSEEVNYFQSIQEMSYIAFNAQTFVA